MTDSCNAKTARFRGWLYEAWIAYAVDTSPSESGQIHYDVSAG